MTAQMQPRRRGALDAREESGGRGVLGRLRPHPFDLGHVVLGVLVHLPVVHLQTLLRGEGRGAARVLALERLHAPVNEHVLFQVGLLCELLLAFGAHVFLLLVVHLLDVPVEGVLGAQDHFAAHAMQLLGLFVDLADVLLQRLGVQVDFVTDGAAFAQGLLRRVDAGLVLGEAVVRLETFVAMAAREGQRVVGGLAVGDDLFGADGLVVAVGAVVDAVLRIALKL